MVRNQPLHSTCVNYKLALAESIADDWSSRALAICLCGDWTLCYYTCWPSATPEGWSEALSAPGNLVGQVFRELDVFRNRFYDLNLLISRKAQNPIMVTSRKPFVKWLMALNAPFTKTVYTDLPPTASLEQPLRVSWGAASQAAVLILPQIKLHSQFPGCASFFSWCLRQEHSPSLTITPNHCSWHLTLQNRF